jgi:hypothetical protein
MTTMISDGIQKKTTTTTTSTMAGQTSPSSSLPAEHLEQSQPQQQQQQQQQQQYHYYTLYTQRAWARHRIRHPPSARPFTDFDLAVNFRALQSKTANELVLYASRGPFNDDFPVNLFEFAGWTLKPEMVAKDEELLFQNLSQGMESSTKRGSSYFPLILPWNQQPHSLLFLLPSSLSPDLTAMTFFGPQGPCELDFTVIDRQNGRVAELASVTRFLAHPFLILPSPPPSLHPSHFPLTQP